MSDLVERLRQQVAELTAERADWARQFRLGKGDDMRAPMRWMVDAHKAEAEVERLRALLRDVDSLLAKTPRACDNMYSNGRDRDSFGQKAKAARKRIDAALKEGQ